jgi:hypothetical protein
MRRLPIILAIVIILAGGGYYAYAKYFAKAPVVVTTTTQNNPTLPTSGDAPLVPDKTPRATIDETPTPVKVAERLLKLDVGPVVSGEVVIDHTGSTTDTEVRYLKRTSGNIYSYSVLSAKTTRTSNRTIPGIQEAKWLPNGAIAFVRYLSGTDHNTINTYALPSNGVGGYFLAQNIRDLSVSSTSLFVLGSDSNGSTGTLERVDGSQAKQAFTTPLAELSAMFAGKQYLAYTKPSATLSGYAYVVNATGNFERIAGPLNGLVALTSPSGKSAVISYVQNGALKMSLVTLATHVSVPLPIGTIADKCVWAADDSAVYCAVPVDPTTTYAYPDDWYQGALFFSDRIWKVNVGNRYAELVLDASKDAKTQVDATNLAIDPAQKALVFRNKVDGSLWLYQL